MIQTPSGRRLTAAYVFAFSLIALMTLASHAVLSGLVHQQKTVATVVNLSGRQRMLSQRIASLAVQYAHGDTDTLTDLIGATDLFEQSHEALIHGSRTLGIPAPSATIQSIYFEGPHPLDASAREFVARARAIAGLRPGSMRMAAELTPLLAAARSPLLDELNAIVVAHHQTSDDQLDGLGRIQMCFLIVVLATLVAEAFGVFLPLARSIKRHAQELARTAMIDPLTNVLNRRGFDQLAAAEISRAGRTQRALSILMIDIDHFKSVNDTHGHASGDQVLVALAGCLSGYVRSSDILGRLGGEEFAILLADTPLDGAVIAAERIRCAITKLRVGVTDGSIGLTVSVGVAELDSQATTLTEALGQADSALYQAKASGRDRVVTACELYRNLGDAVIRRRSVLAC